MAGWAAGVFTRARNWVTDKSGAINPQAALFDQEDDNFASGLNNCVTKDGLNKPSAAMDFNGQNLTGVAVLTATGLATFSGGRIIGGTISPTALPSGNTNDYAPTGFASATILRITPNVAGSVLTGIAGGVDGRMVILQNVTTSFNLNLAQESASSAAANRFSVPNSPTVVGPYSAAIIWYDGTSSRWRPFSIS